MNKSKTSLSQEPELDSLESHLAGTLKRVQPPRELVRRLRGRIRLPQRAEIATRLRDWQALFLALGGVLSGTLVIITLARALYHLFGRKSM